MDVDLTPGDGLSSSHVILCCLCGTPIEPNTSNMCVACVRNKIDITESIPKQSNLQHCKSCDRYFQPPTQWLLCQLESRELLAVCLRKLKSSLTGVRLVDAAFLWTEPHSKRIKVKLTIQREIASGAIAEQSAVVEFVVQNQMCSDCHRVEAKDFWKAVVQVRQRTAHKKTFLYLEQLIIKHEVHAAATRVKQESDGLDFFFPTKAEAVKFLNFLQSVVPCKYKTSQRLISQDFQNNVCNYKHTIAVEIVPVCKDNIVCLSRNLANSLGNVGQLLVCLKVSNCLHFIDPWTLQIAEVSSNAYWRSLFPPLFPGNKSLVEFIVMDVEEVTEDEKLRRSGAGSVSSVHSLANVWVVRSNELGSGRQLFTRTHLGRVLHPGDTVRGYDFTTANINNDELVKMKPESVPDVVLIRKVYGDRSRRHASRGWKLRQLDKEAGSVATDFEYIGFLEDLEEDVELRGNVNIYRDSSKAVVEPDDPELPVIRVAEMLEDLNLETLDNNSMVEDG